jgi:biopolymer transport protein ExbD
LPRKHEPEELNISPLIDMVFILLIFFAVSTTFVKDLQVELERPNAQTSAAVEQVDPDLHRSGRCRVR